MKPQDIRSAVTAQLIKLMESGNARPWRQPWSFGPNSGIPSSQATEQAYTGGNAVTLDLMAMTAGYRSKWWNTFNNWKLEGVFPKQGQKATWGMWYGRRGIEQENAEGEKTTKWIPSARSFCLFNAEQCHGDGDKLASFLVTEQRPENHQINYELFDEMIQKLGVEVKTGTRACLEPSSCIITMPSKGHFDDMNEYYSVLAHELCHWAEFKAGIRERKGSRDEYADHELSAEIGSAYLLRELGIPAVTCNRIAENSAIYLSGWLSKMKKDSSYIFTVSARSSRLVDFLMDRKKENSKVLVEA